MAYAAGVNTAPRIKKNKNMQNTIKIAYAISKINVIKNFLFR
jgi:hypothetical protein